MQNVLMYIDDHSQENINIESLARTYHMSYSYFARQFRKYYGQSCKLVYRICAAEQSGKSPFIYRA